MVRPSPPWASPPRQVVFDATGERIATARLVEGFADVWDVQTGDKVVTIAAPSEIVDIVYSPDGSSLATGHADGTVRLWDPDTGVEQLVLHGDAGRVGHVVFGPDGSTLASVGDNDGISRVWALDLDDLIAIARRPASTRTLTDAECRQYLHVEAAPTPDQPRCAGRDERRCHGTATSHAARPPPASCTLLVSHHRCRWQHDTRGSRHDTHHRSSAGPRVAHLVAAPEHRAGRFGAIVGWAAAAGAVAAAGLLAVTVLTPDAAAGRGSTRGGPLPSTAASARSSTGSSWRWRPSPGATVAEHGSISAIEHREQLAMAAVAWGDGRRARQHQRDRAPRAAGDGGGRLGRRSPSTAASAPSSDRDQLAMAASPGATVAEHGSISAIEHRDQLTMAASPGATVAEHGSISAIEHRDQLTMAASPGATVAEHGSISAIEHRDADRADLEFNGAVSPDP